VTSDTITRFNRDTVWLATGVLGTVVFAALVIAVQERQAAPTQAERDFFLFNSDSASVGSVIESPNSKGKMISGLESSVDHAFTETSQRKTPSSQTESAASTPSAVLALTPEVNRDADRQDSARVRRAKNRNVRNRAFMAFGPIDVKRRLIELWHQSLARSKKPRNWTAFSTLSPGVSKKAAYTAETNH
jgi:hypothetical protein